MLLIDKTIIEELGSTPKVSNLKFFQIAFQGMVTQMPAAALVDPGDLLKHFPIVGPPPSFSGVSLHVLTI